MAEANPNESRPDDLMPADIARQEILNVSKNRLSEWLNGTQLRWWPNPFDRRMKLVSRAEVTEFAKSFPREQGEKRAKKEAPEAA